MAHQLSLYDGVEGTTLALAATAATGYHLIAYNPSMSGYAEQRNSTMYAPGDISVVGKYGNIVETVTLEIVGTTRDDLYVKLRALYRFIENARDWVQNPNLRSPSYMVYKPDSTTNEGYSAVLGGRVDVAGIDANILAGAGGEAEQLANTMTGIVLTIEREPFYRSAAPAPDAYNVLSNFNSNMANAWRNINLGTIIGDISAGAALNMMESGGVGNLARIIWGYSSAARKGAGYAGAGLIECEAGTNGTDTTSTTDVTASPGGAGNTKKRCTFATATDAIRLTMTASPGAGTFRIYMRCKLSAAGTVAAYMQYQPSTVASSSKITNAPVSITHTTWQMVDLGLVVLPAAMPLIYNEVSAVRTLYISASRSAGAASLDMDFIFIMPVDEGLVEIRCAPITVNFGSANYSSCIPTRDVAYIMDTNNSVWATCQLSGSMRFQPGAGYVYLLCGDTNFGNTLGSTGTEFHAKVEYSPFYLAPRGNG